MTELRCKHRHTIYEHPNCFLSGEVGKDVFWFVYEQKKIGYLDIEAETLFADTGIMISWCIKPVNQKEILYDYITKDDINNFSFDYRITKSLLEALNNFDIIVTYYGTNFDIPYIRAKGLYHKLEVPGFNSQVSFTKRGEKKIVRKPAIIHWDLYYLVRNKLLLTSRSLANVCSYLGIKGKTKVDKSIWNLAKYGDEKAVQYILEHNKKDVEILEKLHLRLLPFSKWNRTGM